MGTEDERLKVESMVDKAAHLFDLGGDMSGEPSAALGMTGRFSLLVFFFSSFFSDNHSPKMHSMLRWNVREDSRRY
jgi:hypothetical protein